MSDALQPNHANSEPLATKVSDAKSTNASNASHFIPITVIVLTKDEELNLPECLRNVSEFFDDVLVLDSGSSDRTTEIARHAGIHVYTHAFTGFGDQRNFAIDHLPHRYQWVLHLDADERVTPEFAEELRQVISKDPHHAGFYVPNRLMLGEQWLRYSSGYPVYQVRLFHRDRLRFANFGHGQREVTEGELGYIQQPYLHFAFSKGLVAWMQKHAVYASEEAKQAVTLNQSLFHDFSCVLSRRSAQRRRAIKALTYRLPMRSWLRFLQVLILNRGFLDGRAGWTYARMIAAYEQMTSASISAHRVGARL